MTATELAPASMTERALSRVMPPMATSGFVVRARARRRPSRPTTGSGFCLRGGGEDGADGDVVGGGQVGGADLVVGVGGDADDAVGADDAPGVFGGEVGLAYVDAVEVGEDGEVGAVVEDELAVEAGEDFAEGGGGGEDFLRGAGLVAVLDEGDSGGAEAYGELAQADAALLEDVGIDDGVEGGEIHSIRYSR